MVDILVRQNQAETSAGTLAFGDLEFRCALGRGGVRADKCEGDGATPRARMKLRRVFYRPDRVAKPVTLLAARALTQTDGWCDDPAAPDYNRLVHLPHPARHEQLWRDSPVYDVLVELGWNDDPVIANRGSAIFLHVAREDYAPTEGCVALMRADLIALLALVPAECWLDVRF